MSLKTFAMLLLSLPAFLAAQAKIMPRPMPPLLPPHIVFPPEVQAKPIQTSTVDIKTDIAAFLAQTTITITVFNPNDQILEGELMVPLPAGATVAGYALDVNGTMIDGVIVNKTKAKVVFDDIVRQGVDPGLVEQAAGNTFRTRVYPLPANGTRTIRLSYVAPLIKRTENGQTVAYYQQPLRFPDLLRSFKLTINALATEQPPVIVAGKLGGLNFNHWNTVHTATIELRDIALTEDLLLAVPASPRQALVQKPAPDAPAFIAATTTLALPADKTSTRTLNAVTILWDASLSRAHSDHHAEFQFLQKALQNVKDLTLIVFRHKAEPLRQFQDVHTLIDFLQKTPFDGATNLAQALAAIPKETTDAILLSDGIETIPQGKHHLPPNCRLVALFADKEQNLPVLRQLTTRSGGFVTDLRALAAEQAVKQLTSPTPSVSKITLNERDITSDTLWKLTGQTLHLAAELKTALPAKAQLAVTLSDGTVINLANTCTLPEGKLTQIFYGTQLIDDLVAAKAPQAQLAQASRRFQLVSPVTSLLVLDSLEQYLQHSIRPPETMKEWRRKFDAAKKDQTEQDEDFKLADNDPKYVDKLWNNLVEWHKKDFPTTPPPAPKPEKRRRGFFGASNEVRSAARVTAGDAAVALEDGAAMAMAATPNLNAAAPQATQERAASPDDNAPTIALQPWSSEAEYLQPLRDRGLEDPYPIYLKLREKHFNSPGFYMDCANFFQVARLFPIATQVISNLAEIKPDDTSLLRICAYHLRFAGRLELAAAIFRNVLKLAPHEPQSYRDLALTLDDLEQFQEAIDVMLTLIKKKFDQRFPEIEAIALVELNRIADRAEHKNIKVNLDKKYRHSFASDLRIVLNWDADMTDMDLWTTDKYQEKCFYGHRLTATGGYNSCDFTQGYGPEVFMIRKALDGDYVIEANYYGSHAQKVLGPITLYAEVFTNYARPNEHKKVLCFSLDTKKQVVKLGTASIKKLVKSIPSHYQIKLGDTLQSIANSFYDNPHMVDAILKLNPQLANRSRLPVGTIIQLPTPEPEPKLD